MSAIAFIGLGNMGAPMAANLIKAGHSVVGYDTNAAALAALAQAGGRQAGSATSAAQTAEIVVTMLPAGEHVRAVYLGPDGSDGRGPDGLIAALRGAGVAPLLIDCSTIEVDTARAVARAAAEAGFDMLDAPVSGGVGGATAGTLTFMVGGSEAAFARGKPVLEAMGRNIVLAGGSGAGQAAKICNNMILGVSMIAVAEAFVLADRLGLDAAKLFEVSSTASGQCWSLTSYCPVPGPVPSAPSNRDYAPGFAVALMLKDLKLSQAAAEAADAATPLGAQAAALYQRLVESGEAGRDFSVVYRWLSGIERRSVVPT
jgi:3-hydroxyisobutyrate dehydrogenase